MVARTFAGSPEQAGVALPDLAAIDVRPYRFRLPRPIRTARTLCLERTGWHIIVHTAAGHTGIGDVSPWPGFGTAPDACSQALATLTQTWAHRPWPMGDAMAAQMALLPVEVAYGLSCALHDIAARRGGISLAQYIVGHAAPEVPVHALVDNALEAQAAIAQGYRAIKVKVGVEPVSDEVTRIVALRAAIGPSVGLRLDANGAWPVPVAIRAARLLAMVSPEWLEQPVAAADLAGMAEVRRLGGVPIAADESITKAQDLDLVIAQAAADIIVIKPMFLGSLETSMALGKAAHKAGLGVIVTHALESAVGRLGALHVALALGITKACGLGGALPAEAAQMPHVTAGRMRMPATWGLGLTDAARAGLTC